MMGSGGFPFPWNCFLALDSFTNISLGILFQRNVDERGIVIKNSKAVGLQITPV
jgi:hypothetical protein